MQEGPKTTTGPIASSKVQAMVQILEKSQIVTTELDNQKLPYFVHLISCATLWLKFDIFTFLGSLRC